jgi:hypothetical protein
MFHVKHRATAGFGARDAAVRGVSRRGAVETYHSPPIDYLKTADWR